MLPIYLKRNGKQTLFILSAISISYITVCHRNGSKNCAKSDEMAYFPVKIVL